MDSTKAYGPLLGFFISGSRYAHILLSKQYKYNARSD